ncbi:hypothetical protein RCL_jg14898.t1 [Rhizophagus clarus]|uniref:Uncharacterized protein n=1 Tax=Rhizophagus clarus TaxID=94130 RepID=A0A8H3M149_9GLOM|nr:hypothetical protein RCL_jg14898.t1 [Rhizophagus clarus]
MRMIAHLRVEKVLDEWLNNRVIQIMKEQSTKIIQNTIKDIALSLEFLGVKVKRKPIYENIAYKNFPEEARKKLLTATIKQKMGIKDEPAK